MLTVSGLTKKYEKLVANDEVSFDVQPGEIAVLMGPNGAGKSTTIKCIAGLLRFNGHIMICGIPNKKEAARRSFGYVPELPALFPMLTVWEHLEFISRAYKLENWQERAESLLQRMELDDKKKKLGQELSKGMQQKVSLCCALMPQPKVILLDEPLVGLDPHAIKELKNLLIELRQNGCAILVSTHMLDSVAEFWDKALIMKEGKIKAIRSRTEIEESGENLEQLFFSITENEGAAQ